MEIITTIIINPSEYSCYEGVIYYPLKLIDEIYYASPKGAIPVAYCMEPKNEDKIVTALEKLRKKRNELRDLEAEVFYKILPKLRIK